MIPKISRYFSTQPIERAYLFGSCSRGEEHKDSDVDLLVQYDKSQRISLFTICGMMVELEKIIHRPVDMIEDEGLKDFARASAERDKILIYERAH